MAIRVTVWGENIHDRENEAVRSIYPKGMHGAIAEALNQDAGIKARTATLDQPEHGLPEARLAETDVLTWWGHRDHGEVDDEVVERVAERVWQGMGLIVLHSGHFSKIFKKLMGTPCSLQWREAGEKERVWVINRSHPIAAGLDPISSSRRPRCTASRSWCPSRWRRCSSAGTTAARSSAPALPSSVAPAASSISRPATRSIRSTTTRTSGRC